MEKERERERDREVGWGERQMESLGKREKAFWALTIPGTKSLYFFFNE